MVDALFGILVLLISIGFVFQTVALYETVNQRAFEYDLANRTVVNVLVRQFVKCEICKNINGFEIIEKEDGFTLSKNNVDFHVHFGR
ncbi:hypothetical protein [Pseudothermotoga thermarum]|uniref:hypothetical protein n=1 Tax=Pseudothermotoga thermarum TaxID=119394 RepID=UPI00059D998E|nr:hypothetical protein [Pseudothermotoga thermarum]